MNYSGGTPLAGEADPTLALQERRLQPPIPAPTLC
jgi:hypothetical protein